MSSEQILTPKVNLVPTGSVGQENQVPDWQTAMQRAIRDPAELRRSLGLAPDQNTQTPSFPTFVPLEFLSRIEPGNPDDPLLRQVMTAAEEHDDVPGFVSDPVGDIAAHVAPGVLHKYQGRALIIVTGACGVHCRYCFRREFPYTHLGISREWPDTIAYLRDQDDVQEVLLSGGDPLTLVDTKIDRVLQDLESIPQLQRVRVHTRMPVVIPQRVTDELIARFVSSRLTPWFVIHANHPNELDGAVLGATDRLIDAGIPVLNQAVLLRGVNDHIDVLHSLCEKLINHRIQPYYLHQLDRVRGSAHFEVPTETGRQLVMDLRKRLPGYAVPTYVGEHSGRCSKTPL